MSWDAMGPKERGWFCAGFLTLLVWGLADPVVLDLPSAGPILCLPHGWPDSLREMAYGWARSELCEQRRGWLGALRTLVALTGDEAA